LVTASQSTFYSVAWDLKIDQKNQRNRLILLYKQYANHFDGNAFELSCL